MFETEKTGALIYAFCEWYQVNSRGEPDKDGEYALVYDIWIHPAHRGNGVLRRMLHKAAERHPQVKEMYYQHANRRRQYSRKQLKEDS